MRPPFATDHRAGATARPGRHRAIPCPRSFPGHRRGGAPSRNTMTKEKDRVHRSHAKTPGAPATSGAQIETEVGDRGPRTGDDKAIVAAESLPQLAEQIRRAFAQIQDHIGRLGTALQAATGHALNVGRLLNRAKELLPHGDWERWLEANAPGLSPRTARRWMLEAKRPTLADLTPVGRMMSPREAMRLLADGPDRAKAARPAKVKAPRDSTRKEDGGDRTESNRPESGADDITGTPHVGDTGRDDGAQDPQDEYVRLLDQVQKVMVELRDPAIVLSPECLRRSREFERSLRRFIESAEANARGRDRHGSLTKLSPDEESADSRNAAGQGRGGRR